MPVQRSARPYIDLPAVIPASHFRTVEGFEPEDLIRKETPVSLTLKKRFMKRLSFPLPWDGRVFAYVRWSPGFRSFCQENGLEPRDLRKLYLVDWDDRFMLILETQWADREMSFSVEPEQLRQLLENCMRIPAQRVQ